MKKNIHATGGLGVPLICGAVVLLIPFAALTWKFQSGFLMQFFISPFQFFILVPWSMSFWSIRKGSVPLKSGGRIDREKDPRNFWISVWFGILAGAFMFAFNLYISWQVLSRR